MDWIIIGLLLAAAVVWALFRYNSRTAGSDGTHHAGIRSPNDWLKY
jgi:hypothetical protein